MGCGIFSSRVWRCVEVSDARLFHLVAYGCARGDVGLIVHTTHRNPIPASRHSSADGPWHPPPLLFCGSWKTCFARSSTLSTQPGTTPANTEEWLKQPPDAESFFHLSKDLEALVSKYDGLLLRAALSKRAGA